MHRPALLVPPGARARIASAHGAVSARGVVAIAAATAAAIGATALLAQRAPSSGPYVLAALAVTLGACAGAAVVLDERAARWRRQATETAVLAEFARRLLEHGGTRDELPVRAAGTPPSAGLCEALASLQAVAIDQERLRNEALEAEALRRSDALKTALLRTVSHDLRSPLMTILTSASALSRDDLALADEDRGELLAGILSEAGRLDHLVSNLLDLSRLQAGASAPVPAVSTADSLVIQALGSLGKRGERVDVTLTETPVAVRVDAHQIERVLANLIENAVKYSPDRAARVVVGSHGREATVRVIDDGPGVAPDALERVFEPFRRCAAGDAPGAGLGLAIARGFAEANGGRVWAESRAGQGATFVLALPMIDVSLGLA